MCIVLIPICAVLTTHLTALSHASWLDFGEGREGKGGREREWKKSGRGKERNGRGGNGKETKGRRRGKKGKDRKGKGGEVEGRNFVQL